MKYFLATILLFTISWVCGLESDRPLQITLGKGDFSDPNYFVANFKNVSESNLRVLKPKGGSEWSMFLVEPRYEMSFRDTNGKLLAEKAHCKLVGPFPETNWPDDYYLDLEPGESATIKLYVAADIPSDGVYSAQLTYQYQGKMEWNGKKPKGVWKGKVSSETTDLKLSKTTLTDLGTRSSLNPVKGD